MLIIGFISFVLIIGFISFMVCSWRRQGYRIVHTISISIQNRDYDCSVFTPESTLSAGEKYWSIGLCTKEN